MRNPKAPTADELRELTDSDFLAIVEDGIARARRLLGNPHATEARREEIRGIIRTLESVRGGDN